MTVPALAPAPVLLQQQDAAPEPVRLAPAALRAIHALTAAAKPFEGCGYLVGEATGDGARILDARATRNLHPEPRTRYAVDPEAYLALEDELEGTGREVVGIVHSHPFSDAVPSPTDREHAAPGWWYLIHGFPPHAPDGVLRAWRLDDDAGPFLEHPLEIPSW